MPTGSGDAEGASEAVARAVEDALLGLPDGQDLAAADAPIDQRSLRLGMRLGLERPDEARALLALVAGSPATADAAGDAVSDEPAGALAVPARSSLLARAAALPPAERERLGPDVRFGWAQGLTPAEILAIGRVVRDMLAAGSTQDLARGFGLAWDDGVRLPNREREDLFREFTELEVVVAGVLAGRDLRGTDQPVPRPRGIRAWLEWVPVRVPGQAQADAAIDQSGETGQRGLVALWNVWMAMRFRALIPHHTFGLLVHPWITVVGPLPEA